MHSPHKDFRWGQHAFSSRHDLDMYEPPYSVVGAPEDNPLSSVRGPREMTAHCLVKVVSNRNIKIMKLASWKKNDVGVNILRFFTIIAMLKDVWESHRKF